jgi:hypothetical protein
MKIDPALYQLLEQAAIPPKEKAEFLPLAKRLVGYARKSQKEGLLSLENDVSLRETDTQVSSYGRMVLDGCDAEKIDTAFLLEACMNNIKGAQLFKLVLIWMGMRMISEGMQPEIAAMLFAKAFGKEFESSGTIPLSQRFLQ